MSLGHGKWKGCGRQAWTEGPKSPRSYYINPSHPRHRALSRPSHTTGGANRWSHIARVGGSSSGSLDSVWSTVDTATSPARTWGTHVKKRANNPPLTSSTQLNVLRAASWGGRPGPNWTPWYAVCSSY